ncbi:MAG: transcriptional repressor LexA, partial [Gammaproteobacteria bacterium]
QPGGSTRPSVCGGLLGSTQAPSIRTRGFDWPVRLHLARYGEGPLTRELMDALGIQSKGALHRTVKSLIDKGYLQQAEHSWRSLRLLDHPGSTLPLLGRIAAGRPIEAISDHDEVDVVEMLLGRDRFALRVQGDSMCEAGILDGDTVIVKQTTSARTGDIVVALIDREEATLKRFKRLPNAQIQLIPANAAFATMTYEPEQVQIQGVVVGQLRVYEP